MQRNEAENTTRDASDVPNSSVAEAGFKSPQVLTETFIRAGLMVPPEIKGQWVLYGVVPASMFDECYGREAPTPLVHVAYCRTSVGGSYLVITHQVSSRQHRFLIPLWDAEVFETVKVMREGRMRFMLVRSSGRDAAVFPLNFAPTELDAAFVKAPPTDPKVLEKLLIELPGIVNSVRQLDAIPGCVEMGNVSEVAVSVVPPVQAAWTVVDAMT